MDNGNPGNTHLQPLWAGLGWSGARTPTIAAGTAGWAAGPGKGLGNAVTSFVNPLTTPPPTTLQ